jgi:hypothetical protein
MGAIALVAEGIADTVLAIDKRVGEVLFPIIRIDVGKPARIEAKEGIVGKK